MSIEQLIRPNIRKLKPYSSARDEYEGKASVFLDANENPFNTSYNRYPDPLQKELKGQIALLKDVKANQIFLGNGSDEAIDLLIRAFCEPGIDQVLIPQPTYGMYQVSADINNVNVIEVPLSKAFDVETDVILKAITDKTKLIFLCSPNNPTGNIFSTDKIIALLKNFNGLVIVDEAYIDFAESPSFITQLLNFENLVILQTFSKAWGLAGLRLGMCFANSQIIAVLNKIKPPYNINTVTQSIVLEQFQNHSHIQKNKAEIVNQRQLLFRELAGLKIVAHVFPSNANFLLVKFNDSREVYSTLLQKGIVVRDRSNVILCDGCLRITLGTPSENKILLTELNKL
ncbi:histidinol-phosphate aminotransferase [Cytophagales bacterium WSM2-2]|nr:histidinol-phosphate aminotransferase [Cytophagales bacterium WSM2-2]